MGGGPGDPVSVGILACLPPTLPATTELVSLPLFTRLLPSLASSVARHEVKELGGPLCLYLCACLSACCCPSIERKSLSLAACVC